jgi:hypothetical protein
VFITGLQKMASDMGWQCNNNIGKNKQWPTTMRSLNPITSSS